MKKILVLVLFFGLALGSVLPSRGLAQTDSDVLVQALQTQIQALLAQIAQLQAQMVVIQGGGLYQDPADLIYQSEPGPTVNINPEKKFFSGDRVRSTFDLNVRETPGGKSLAIVKPYTQGKVSAGPESNGGYFWWLINYDNGVSGFSVGDFLEKVEVYSTSVSGNQAPILEETSLVSPTSVGAGDSNWWRLRASDPEGGKVIYKVNWGDGTSNTFIMPSFRPATTNPLYVSDVPAQPGTDVAATHIYTNPGFYTIQLVVTDEQGAGVSRNLSVEVISKDSINTRSSKFLIGDMVQTTDYLNVRTGPSGVPVGIQPPGKKATVTGGPVWSILGKWWWSLNYEDGIDGWSAEDWLVATGEKALVPLPLPDPIPTPPSTPVVPVITMISPSGGTAGSRVVITGSGFTLGTDVALVGSLSYGSPIWGERHVQIDSLDGRTLAINIPNTLTQSPSERYGSSGGEVGVLTGKYYFIVQTVAGKSNIYDFNVLSANLVCGDIDGNGVINQNDLDNPASENDLTGYVFGGVAIPSGVNADLNGDGVVDISDVSVLTNYVKRGGPAPTCGVGSSGGNGSPAASTLSSIGGQLNNISQALNNILIHLGL